MFPKRLVQCNNKNLDQVISKLLTLSKCFTCILISTFCFNKWNIFEHVLRHFIMAHDKTTYGLHTDDIRVYTSDIRVTYGWHTIIYEWHMDDIRVHMSDIRMTYECIRVTYHYIRVHTSDIQMICEYMRLTYE